MGPLLVLRRWWWLIVLLTLLGAAGAYMIGQRQALYEASMTLLVTSGTPNREVAEQLIPDQRNSLVKTYRELLLKRPVLEAVIAELGLQMSPEELFALMAIYEVRDTRLLILSARSKDPQQAAAIVNTTVVAFNRLASTLLANPFAEGRVGLSVVEAAFAPPQSWLGGPLRLALIAAFLSLLLALGLVFTIELLDPRLRTATDVAQLHGLATVAEIGVLHGRGPRERLVTLRAPTSRAAEVYRMLRLLLEPGAQERTIRSVIVTSAEAGEGKSLTAANLAVAMAQTGLRTILIDANLRRPVLHELFGLPQRRGAAPAGAADAQRVDTPVTVESGLAQLRLLLSGDLSSPAQPPGAEQLRALLAQLEPEVDLVIVDSPALLESVETALLARACDAALVVVRAGRTRPEQLQRACEALARTQALVLGVVLNRAERAAVGTLGAPEPQPEALPSGEDYRTPGGTAISPGS